MWGSHALTPNGMKTLDSQNQQETLELQAQIGEQS